MSHAVCPVIRVWVNLRTATVTWTASSSVTAAETLTRSVPLVREREGGREGGREIREREKERMFIIVQHTYIHTVELLNQLGHRHSLTYTQIRPGYNLTGHSIA